MHTTARRLEMRCPMDEARLIPLPVHQDGRGALGVAESGAHVPFAIARAFYITNVPAGAVRSGHAHSRCRQFLVLLTGSCVVTLAGRNGETRCERLYGPGHGLYVPAQVWTEVRGMSPGAALLVLASDRYDPSDYEYDRAAYHRPILTGCSP